MKLFFCCARTLHEMDEKLLFIHKRDSFYERSGITLFKEAFEKIKIEHSEFK